MKITYCTTDEAPCLAWYSWSPIVRSFSKPFGVEIEEVDASLGQLLIAELARQTGREARVQNPLDILANAIEKPTSIVIKPPCISANDTQIRAAIDELRTIGLGAANPLLLPAVPAIIEFNRLRGSVVNRLLRQGTMVRELNDAPTPHRDAQHAWIRMAEQCEVSSMADADFRSTEQSISVTRNQTVRIELVDDDRNITILTDPLDLSVGDIASFSTLEQKSLREFLRGELNDAKSRGVLFSLQLKANVFAADQHIFAEAIRVYYDPIFKQFADTLNDLGIDESLGINAVTEAEKKVHDPNLFRLGIGLSESAGPELAVNAGETVSHLHSRSGPSIARSMADAILGGGRLRDRSGNLRTTKFVIPDGSYAGFYRAVIDDFVCSGCLEPEQVRNISIVGMTKDCAEEYGAQGTTFWIPKGGDVQVVNDSGEVLCRQHMDTAGVWRMMVVSMSAVDSWITTTVEKARILERTAVFWLDCDRPHHREIIKRVQSALEPHPDAAVDLRILGIEDATRFTLAQLRSGKGVIVACGNVLRDYVSELIFASAGHNKHYSRSYTKFPNGGYSFEVGTGGTAPKVFLDFQHDNFLRWNPTSDAIALVAAYEEIARRLGNSGVALLAEGLMHSINLMRGDEFGLTDLANFDTRRVHFHLAMNWASWIACHSSNASFKRMAEELRRDENEILQSFSNISGVRADSFEHYFLNRGNLLATMRPSAAFNSIIDQFYVDCCNLCAA